MADDPGSDKVDKQLKKFKDVLKHFEEVPLVHICNTGGAVHYDLEPFDMVRTGLTQLGYAAGRVQPDWLEPVLTWKSKVVQVRKIQKGDSVSYGGTWTASKECYIGSIPVGYGDGVPRSLSNKLKVSVNGEMYPVVGNVTMDYIMINLGDSKIQAESEATILGADAWDASKWAEEAGSNVHEILTGLSGRMARNYTDY
jgi:alanine racemase